jgi:hypothetical protein
MTSSEKDMSAVVNDDEAFKSEHAERTAPMPASIAGMSEAELRTMEKKMVRKMDMVIM